MEFDVFVLPFILGLSFICFNLVLRFSLWILEMDSTAKEKIFRSLFSSKVFYALGETVMECLIHRRIFRKNVLLGYMHMSLALGWFLLIVTGNIESSIFSVSEPNPPYIPIFFRYFHPYPETTTLGVSFSFLMDLFLLFTLSGAVLAWTKRFFRRPYGMQQTTRLRLRDQLALYSLWLIFPLRLLAESFTSGTYGGGSFLTNTTGQALATILPVDKLAYPAWWAYSSALGMFFFMLPWSRYMHIPTEVFLIYLRHCGIRDCKHNHSLRKFHLNACSRCGICIDGCPSGSIANVSGVQAVYMIKQVRQSSPSPNGSSDSCMLCGRCQSVCPVGVETLNIRLSDRSARHCFEPAAGGNQHLEVRIDKADVFYFPGCLSSLTPGAVHSMRQLMDMAGVNYTEGTGLCCGKPTLQAGYSRQAQLLTEDNTRLIHQSGARLVVTNCPICYQMLSTEYRLKIPVMHHSQFLLELVHEKRLLVKKTGAILTYHDPCELARNMGITEEPRELLQCAGRIKEVAENREKAQCCGGSLGNLHLNPAEQSKITRRLAENLSQANPDYIVTGCPLCKRTIASHTQLPVRDIAEIVWESTQTALFQHNDYTLKATVAEEV